MNILYLSCSRSGHHSIINWLCSQLSGKTEFLSQCWLGWEQKKLVPLNKKRVWNFKTKGSQTNKLFSIDDFDLDLFKIFKFKLFDIDLVIVQNRDVYNWVASCLKGGGSGSSSLSMVWKDPLNRSTQSTITLWKKMIRQSLKEENFIENKKVYDINFNEWFSNISYRKKIADDIGFKFTDKGLNEVLSIGGGSSFDKRKYDKKGQTMDVLNRWKNFQDNETFKTLVKDKELERLNKKYFGFSI